MLGKHTHTGRVLLGLTPSSHELLTLSPQLPPQSTSPSLLWLASILLSFLQVLYRPILGSTEATDGAKNLSLLATEH